MLVVIHHHHACMDVQRKYHFEDGDDEVSLRYIFKHPNELWTIYLLSYIKFPHETQWATHQEFSLCRKGQETRRNDS